MLRETILGSNASKIKLIMVTYVDDTANDVFVFIHEVVVVVVSKTDVLD
jgi:hypothetical protein